MEVWLNEKDLQTIKSICGHLSDCQYTEVNPDTVTFEHIAGDNTGWSVIFPSLKDLCHY